MRPFSALKHLVYFETLAETEENTPQWNATTAGLVVLRLLDTWVDFGAVSLRENARGIKNIRAAIDAIGDGSPVRKILHGLLESVERSKHPDMSGIIPRLMAYGRALHYEGSWRLSNDVYQTVLDYTTETDDPDVVIDAHMQMGYCQRMLAKWEEAAHAYAQAGQIASAQGDMERVLRARIADAKLTIDRGNLPGEGFRARIADAKLAIDRGNLPQAEALLDDTIMQARAAAGLTEIRSLALHERATVAYMRGQFESSVKLGYDALEGLQNPTARDRVLSDIAASFGELGVLSAARDALVIVAATAQELYLRWVAEINLMEIASKQREEPAFEMYRRELEDAELPASLLAHYHLFVGRGYMSFGRIELARTSLERALTVASHHKFNQIVFEAEKVLQLLERSEREKEEVAVEPTPEIARIAQAISDMRVAAGIGV